MNTTTTAVPLEHRNWLALAGKSAFWFFFVKGLLWLAAPLVFYYLR